MKTISKGLIAVLITVIIGIMSIQSCNKKSVIFNNPSNNIFQSSEILDKYPQFNKIMNTKSNLYKNFELSNLNSVRPRVYFRWDQCFRPLGICLIGAPNDPPPPSWLVKGENGEGFADLYMLDSSHLLLFPNQIIYQDNLVPVSNDIIIDTTTASHLGYAEIIINSGLYEMKFDLTSKEFNFGYVILNCQSKQ